jgi:5-formyltetrahydrofolate cyclo-ligase
MEIAGIKAEARREAFARRKVARQALGPAPEAATAAVAEAILAAGPRIVSGYLPIRTEIDPRPAMGRLHEGGARLCVPVIEGPGRPLRFREWRPDSALEPGPFGAAVPTDGEWLTPDALIVPLLAFDRRMFRLGYGGGFYDRTLAGLREGGPVRAIGLAYGAQEVEAVPVEATDIPLDAVATERGLLGG